MEEPMRTLVKVDAAGRLVLPQEVRQAFGVDDGGRVLLVDEHGRLEVRRDPTTAHVEVRDGWPEVAIDGDVIFSAQDTAAAVVADRADR
jgi:AbrB family looped-hinge helix DNA binding protein